MKQTREIKHGDGHIDIETLFGDVWAVTKCNLEVAMPTFTTREYLQKLDSNGYKSIPTYVMKVKDVLALYARIDELEAMVANLNEGAKIMHAFATGGESKLLADWQTEAEALAADARDYAMQTEELRGGG